MLEEISSIKKLMTISNETEIAGRVYYEGILGDKEVVLTFSRWGKVASSSTVTTLINKFEVSFVIFMGVAGAVDTTLNIGDVVIAENLFQHDMDARPIFEQFQIPLINTIFFKADNDETLRAKKAATNFLALIENSIPEELLLKHSITNPKVYIGTVASGDQFITDPSNHKNLSLSNNKKRTLAVEMEGAAIAQICFEYGVPFVVIRIISDKADHSASLDFQSFISDIASRYSAGIIKELYL